MRPFLESEIHFEFVNFGEKIRKGAKRNDPLRVETNRFYFDVGRDEIQQGVFDTHHRTDSRYLSAASVLTNHLETLHHLYDKNKDLTFVCHYDPDPDAMAAFYLAKKSLESGWRSKSELPDSVLFLVQLIDYWDTGNFKNAFDLEEVTLMSLRLGRHEEKSDINLVWCNRIRWAFNLFELIIDNWSCFENEIRPMLQGDPYSKEADAWIVKWLLSKGYYQNEYLEAKQSILNTSSEIDSIIKSSKHFPESHCTTIRLPKRVNRNHWETIECKCLFIKVSSVINKLLTPVAYIKGFSIVYTCSETRGHEVWLNPTLQYDRDEIRQPRIWLKELNSLLNQFEEQIRNENVRDPSKLSPEQRSLRRPGKPREGFTSSDPWYSTGDFSFVAPPRDGSILREETIYHLVTTFADQYITGFDVSLIVPFSGKHSQRQFEKFGWVKTFPQLASFDAGFHTHVEQYINSVKQDLKPDKQDNRGNLRTLKLQHTTQFEFPDPWGSYDSEIKRIFDDGLLVHAGMEKSKKNSDLKITLWYFPEGVGFFVYNYTIPQIGYGKVHLNNILDLVNEWSNYHLVNEWPDDALPITYFMDSDQNVFKGLRGKPYIFSLLSSETTLWEDIRQEFLGKLLHAKKSNDQGYRGDHFSRLYLESSIELSRGLELAISDEGGALVKTETCYWNDQLIQLYHQQTFISFLLALHQKVFLHKLAFQVAREKKTNLSAIKIMRLDLIRFLTEGWFSQVSSNEVLEFAYQHWKKKFKTLDLLEEVKHDINLINEHLNNIFKSKIQTVTTLLFPFLMWTGFAGMNYGLPNADLKSVPGLLEQISFFPSRDLFLSSNFWEFFMNLGGIGHLAIFYLTWFAAVRGLTALTRKQ